MLKGFILQSVIVPKDNFTFKQAEKWIKENKYKTSFYGKKPDITENFYRFRQQATKNFKKGSYRTKTLPNGVQLILGEFIGGGKPTNKKLYDKIKKEIWKEQPKNSLYRSARLIKEYKKAGGEFTGEKENNINKWMDEKWISLNHYLRGEIVKCGEENTQKQFGEYPLCRPLSIAKKLNKQQIIKLIEAKQKAKEKPIDTSKILGTDKFDIKPIGENIGGSKKYNKGIKTFLKELGIRPSVYLKMARKRAEKAGYNPDNVFLSDKRPHKLYILDNEGNKKYWGLSGYGDFLIYQLLEKKGTVEKGTAKDKRNVYQKSHSKIKGDWKKDKFSPNMLSLKINW